MKTRTIFILLILFTSYALRAQTSGPPRHLFFEYGPIGKSTLGTTATKSNSHFAVGIKYHGWREEKPFQFEMDLDYRHVSFYDSINERKSLGMAEMYIGPRLLISKFLPIYPTLSALAGGYYVFGNTAGFNALLTAGVYYNFTQPTQDRNGVSLEFTYRPVNINYGSFVIPPAWAIRIGFFF